ncbi:PaaI family thioesterase [Rhodococcus sp. IEGM 1318]|uniref:PaaI family thioesterase n=1 Tax=Rhodococcus sp. IEGM 1318 TaxID=3082226 RepID=UPI002954B631|nr:PaaI family thioesterase [Rhodococcus sp. IEGM 1318]MDV8009305.1 PaaI family thioesterase [Rhodococcus sp. IEGM 1318]
MSDMTEFANKIFSSQPFSNFIGAELDHVGKNSAQISAMMREDLRQQHGYAHGGVISYLADNSLTFAGGLALGGDALTAEFKINYVSPARGKKLIARASTLSSGSRQAVCQSLIYSVDEEGTELLCAAAQGTIVATSPTPREGN